MTDGLTNLDKDKRLGLAGIFVPNFQRASSIAMLHDIGVYPSHHLPSTYLARRKRGGAAVDELFLGKSVSHCVRSWCRFISGCLRKLYAEAATTAACAIERFLWDD